MADPAGGPRSLRPPPCRRQPRREPPGATRAQRCRTFEDGAAAFVRARVRPRNRSLGRRDPGPVVWRSRRIHARLRPDRGRVPRAARPPPCRARLTFRKHDERAPADFFAVEAEGLDWLRSADVIAVPAVLAVDADSIELEHIERGAWTSDADERFGRELAALHRSGAPTFGWHRDGYIGPLRVANTASDDWPSFYWTTRVEPFVRAASLPTDAMATFDRVGARLADLAGPPEPPARLHGDLWRGNVPADREGRPWIIDPSAHGGHRETDLAMLQLFGGFGARCFDAYDEAFPLADGWRERVALHQLYPLLVHAVLFGGSYGDQALAAARVYR